MRLHTITLGCQMSVADGDEMTRALTTLGARREPDLERADAVLLTTCTVRQHAEDRAVSLIGRLRKWKRRRKGRFIAVAGCAAERLGGSIRARFPYVDLVLGARSLESNRRALETALAGRLAAGRRSARRAAAHVVARVSVMRGCDFACAYCVVPSVRGRAAHRPIDGVLSDIRERIAEGAREIQLLGQTVNGYRAPEGGDFADLLRAAASVDGVERIRFTSPHPLFLNARMMRAMAELPQVCPHLHLPAQSGSDRTLKAMRRGYTSKKYLAKVAETRRLIPDLALTSDLIVGFPGETDSDFERTLRLVEEADFCGAYCAKYSPRPGTPAAALKDSVPDAAKKERLARLLDAVGSRTRRHLRALKGRRLRVLLETPTDGRTQYHFRARLTRPAEPGMLVDADVTGSTKTALRASLPR